MKRFKNILLVAGGEGWEETALIWAMTIAKNNKAKLKVVEVIEKLPWGTRKLHKSQLAKLVEKHAPGNPNDRIHLLKGSAEILIPALAKRKRIEFIVMGTVCRTGIEGLFIGNTAEKVLQQVDCSVLTVKPDGFVTPVGL